MGVHMKPWAIFVTSVTALCALVGVGVLAYHLKTTSGVEDSPKNETLHAKQPSVVKCEFPEEKCNIRLNPEVFPKHYDIYLFPNITSGKFTGEVTIEIDLQASTVDHFRLHIKNLEVVSTQLKMGATEFPVLGYENTELNYWVVKSTGDHLFSKGTYELKMSFKGSLTPDIVGFYKSSYTDTRTNTTKYVVSSKFQPTYARRAFPSFDEPSFKSTFTVTIVKPSDLVALSNMPIQEEKVNTPEKGLTTVKFHKSVPMVTYLVAFAIGDFAYKEQHTRRGTPVRIYSTSFQVNNTEYASSITAKIVDFFEDYFGIPYPLPKLDVIGIPDFISGAMEHWGMVSFRESNLLYQKGVASAFNKQRIAAVLAHELAHMWFGNLMTLKWWNDLWLNEGFASYMEYKGVNAVHPDWDIETQFVGDDLTPILGLDGQHSSHPIVQDVTNPNQITELFDKISYSKGASVIRMLENFMGPEAFRQGVMVFLKKFSYKNAVTSDLWTELQLQTDSNKQNVFNISLVMDTWTRQMGYPVLSPEWDSSSGHWVLKQGRFLESRDGKGVKEGTQAPFEYKWEIPVGVEWAKDSQSKEQKLVWMRHNTDSVTLPVGKDFRRLKLNSGQFGYYRVKYTEDMYKRIKDDLPMHWTPSERCGALDDAFSLAFSNYMNYNVTLDFAQTLKYDEHLIPWDCSKGHLAGLGRLLKGNHPDAYVLYRKYVISLVTNIYSKLTWTDNETDKHLDRLLKPLIFSMACDNGHTPCLEKTKQLFDKWIADPKSQSNQIPSGLRDAVYKWGVSQSDADKWNKVLQIYLHESDPQERVRLLRALSNSKDQGVLRTFLEMAKNETLIKRQDYFTVLKFMSINPIGNPLIWEFYRNEFKYLVDRFTLNDRYFGRLIVEITNDYSTDIRLREIEHLYTLHPNAGAGSRARQMAVENIKNNIDWSKRNAPVINEWLLKSFRSED